MSYGRNSLPEDADPYEIDLPSLQGRPGIGSIKAVYDKDVGWQITLTPNKAVVNDLEYLKDWYEMLGDAEYQMRLWQVQEFEPGVPIRPEIQAYLDAATLINNHHFEIVTNPDHSYTINAYNSANDCKLELYLLLKACREISFTDRIDHEGDVVHHPMLNYMDEIMIAHKEKDLGDYIKQRDVAAAAFRS